MNVRQIFGLVLLLTGVVLQPLGWMYVTELTVVSLVAIVAGVVLLYAERGRESEGSGGGAPGATGRELPGDIQGHSGQLSGGRSTAWESHHSSDGGGTSD